MQLLLLLALGPVAYITFRIYLAAAKVLFNVFIFLILVIVLLVVALTTKSAPSTSWAPSTPVVATEQVQVPPCADITQLLTESFGPGELCDRYYKSQKCQSEIEAGFEQARIELSPVAVCGTAMPSPIPVAPVPESFDSKASRFLDTVPSIDRQATFERMHDSALPSQSSVSMDEVRNTSTLPVFLAFAKPTGDALAKLDLATAKVDGSLALEGLPMIAPFTGIVRGVYQRTPHQECTLRLRDHSLCIELDRRIKCNVFASRITDAEQVCVDYLIR